MLQIQNLTLTHKSDLTTLVKDLNVTIQPGDKVAIIGEEGNGKSSILKFVLQDSQMSDYLEISGKLINQFDRVGYLPQGMSEADLSLSLSEYLSDRVEIESLDYNLLYSLGAQLGFDADRLFSDQIIQTLSGGERIKVQLLLILLEEPDLLLLDEPSNDLDIETVQWLTRFIATSPLTIIFISHDVALLESTATVIIHLERLVHKTQPKVTVARLSYGDYIEERDRTQSHQEAVALKQREEHAKRIATHRKMEQQVHQALNNTKDASAGRILAKKMANVKAQGARFQRQEDDFLDIPVREDPIDIRFSGVVPLPIGKEVFAVEDEVVRVGDRILAEDINFRLFGQDKVGIIGANGVGKSTLLKSWWQSLMTKEGLSAGYMPQNYNEALDMTQTPVEYLRRVGSQEEMTQIMTYLGSMRYLPEEMNRPISQLSGGQMAKLLLLRLDFHNNNVLFLDEPTRNFSPTSQPEIIQVLQSFPGAMIAVSHDQVFLDEVCEHIYELTPEGLTQLR